MDLLISEYKRICPRNIDGERVFLLHDAHEGKKMVLTGPELLRIADGIDFLKAEQAKAPKRKKIYCNWCTNKLGQTDGKRYCQHCAEKMYRECKRCHRPFPEKRFYELDAERCNACQRKFLREKEKRENQKRQKTSNEENEYSKVERSESEENYD